MLLVPENYMQVPEFKRPLAERKLTQLDENLAEVLQTDFPTDFDKLQAYKKVFGKYMTIYNTKLGPNAPSPKHVTPPSSATTKATPIDNVVQWLPKYQQDKARRFLQLIDSMPADSQDKFGWDESRKMVLEGMSLPDTNIVDFLDYALSKAPKDEPPSYGVFWNAVRKANVPLSVISRAPKNLMHAAAPKQQAVKKAPKAKRASTRVRWTPY